ncbi:hypothetical protein VCUG_00887 [Vavraia culicis subsp. floridensis]|uniref:GOLD domain-containing protein n=1 Tax=Vavraia culicis (isolate floridensis) TaxID=948595 RepID=L2GVB3_VAVCU|nr:uncharacterized protein VCUG_00887 [Vavraia culicis subsp. floridensis]ELA47564.1 hypothetical protein VCUG_00887 [Vavraia culicis subsp. floridensis]
MLKFFILLRAAIAFVFELKPEEERSFEENIKGGLEYRLEYSEKDGKDVALNIRDGKGRDVGEWNTSFSVIHTKSDEDGVFTFMFKNEHNKAVNVKLTVPDLDNEITATTIAKDSNVRSVAELENKLKSIIQQTSEYIERMSVYTKKLAVYKWRIRCFMVLEIIFSMFMVYYLHKDTVGLFERRKRV